MSESNYLEETFEEAYIGDDKPKAKTVTQALPPPPKEPEFIIPQRLAAEVFGTFVLVWFGCGAVMQSKYTGAMTGLGQVTMTWVLGGALAVYTCGNISGGHLNPAVSLAFAIVRPSTFHIGMVIPYAASQMMGAFFAAALNYYLFSESILEFEAAGDFTRGQNGHTFGGAFGCYWSDYMTTTTQAVISEVTGTAMLTFVVFSITHPSNNVPGSLVPALVGVAIGSIISIIGSLSGGGINPARDLGPRILTSIVGWGMYSFEGWWVYTLGPIIGGPLGAGIADGVLRSDK